MNQVRWARITARRASWELPLTIMIQTDSLLVAEASVAVVVPACLLVLESEALETVAPVPPDEPVYAAVVFRGKGVAARSHPAAKRPR